MIFGRMVIDKEETKRCPANVTPGNNPRLLDLAEFDQEHSTSTKDNYVRAMERILVEHLMPLYLKKLFGQNGWRPPVDLKATFQTAQRRCAAITSSKFLQFRSCPLHCS